jgi:hypothetical protein
MQPWARRGGVALGEDQIEYMTVEPVTAAGLAPGLAAGRPISVDASEPTMMAGLNCGSVSTMLGPPFVTGWMAGWLSAMTAPGRDHG